jgi:hypothetical protein
VVITNGEIEKRIGLSITWKFQPTKNHATVQKSFQQCCVGAKGSRSKMDDSVDSKKDEWISD